MLEDIASQAWCSNKAHFFFITEKIKRNEAYFFFSFLKVRRVQTKKQGNRFSGFLEKIDFLLCHVLLPFGQFIECVFGHPQYGLELLI